MKAVLQKLLPSAMRRRDAATPWLSRRPCGKPSLPPLSRQGARVEYVDWLKGLSILLVVAFHTPGHPGWAEFPFRMPLFFMLSGIFFRLRGLGDHVRRKFFQLGVPFLIFYAIGYFHQFGYCALNPWADPWSVDKCRELIDPRAGGYAANAPLWFITALIINQLALWVLVKVLRRKWAVMTVALLLAGAACLKIDPHRPNLMFLRPFPFLPFYTAGFLWGKQFLAFIESGSCRRWMSLLGSLAVMAASVWMCRFEAGHRFNAAEYLFLTAMCAACIVLARRLCKVAALKPLYFLGKNSYIILGLHYMILWDIWLALRLWLGPVVEERASWLFPLFLCSTLLLLIPVIRLINRRVPLVAGKYLPPALRPRAAR